MHIQYTGIPATVVLHVFQIFYCFVIFRYGFYIYFVTSVYAVIVSYFIPRPFQISNFNIFNNFQIFN